MSLSRALSLTDYSVMKIWILWILNLRAEAANCTLSYFNDFKSIILLDASCFTNSDGYSIASTSSCDTYFYFFDGLLEENFIGDFLANFFTDDFSLWSSSDYTILVGVFFPLEGCLDSNFVGVGFWDDSAVTFDFDCCFDEWTYYWEFIFVFVKFWINKN